MPRFILPLLSGLAVGLAFGLSVNSSSMLGFPLSGEKAKEETLYRGQPASFWIRQLQDRDPSFRQQAMWALAHLGPGQEGAVRALAELLEDKNEGVRSGAALNLARMGPAAESAVPQLLAALRDEDQFVRVAAVRALGSICPHDDAVLAALSAVLQDKSEMVRRRTLNILGEIGPPALAILPAVREAMNDSDPEVRQAAADALAKIRAERVLSEMRLTPMLANCPRPAFRTVNCSPREMSNFMQRARKRARNSCRSGSSPRRNCATRRRNPNPLKSASAPAGSARICFLDRRRP